MARIFRTIYFLVYPDLFRCKLIQEIAELQLLAEQEGKQAVVRLNGTTDLQLSRAFQALPQAQLFMEIPSLFPDVQFVEYTKNPHHQSAGPNHNYTFSFSGSNLTHALKILQGGGNVSVVFEGPFPTSWYGFPVIDGDVHDNRYKDRRGVVVALKLKGTKQARKHALQGGFAQPHQENP